MSELIVDNLMHENRVFPVPQRIGKTAHISAEDYGSLYRESIEEPIQFWLEQARSLDWLKFPTKGCVHNWDSKGRSIHHTWFEDGILNTTVSCLDRHVNGGRGDKTAIIWQGDNPDESLTLSYRQLLDRVCQCANGLRSLGVQKGDRVCIYMPMVPEAAIAMLACARIGAIHSVVFGGFSAESLRNRLNDSNCKTVVTADVSVRGGKHIPLKAIADEAMADCPSVEHCMVVNRGNVEINMIDSRDVWYHDVVNQQSSTCDPESLAAEDPLFILYTSGSTGKPKGVVHSQAGYLLYTSLTHKYVFDLHEDDVYWCTADVGWITGHSYMVYGPLANGATTLLFEGIPTYPSPSRFWEVIDRWKVSLFYTAPTAIRALIACGDEHLKRASLESLRVLGTVGEPINPEAWMWYYRNVGRERCPIVDTWWQTETGGILLTSLPGAHPTKPGSAGRPFFGIDPIALRQDGSECDVDEGGSLCMKSPWPSMMRTTWGDHDRFIDTYFSAFDGVYFSGDGARRDSDGNWWLLGRLDDVVNVSGHRIGTAEIESALVGHASVAEAAVIPVPHDVKGQGLVAYVILVDGTGSSDELNQQLIAHVRTEIGPIATPEKIVFAPGLPKTRSGKIMRRILRKLAEGRVNELGDTSTLANPEIVEALR